VLRQPVTHFQCLAPLESHVHGNSGPRRPVGCLQGLGAKPLQFLGKAVDLCRLIVQIQRHPGECFSTATPM
jgi:hypothetical protein